MVGDARTRHGLLRQSRRGDLPPIELGPTHPSKKTTWFSGKGRSSLGGGIPDQPVAPIGENGLLGGLIMVPDHIRDNPHL